MTYLNIYLTDRVYGGPEEDGWWYEARWPLTNNDPDGYIPSAFLPVWLKTSQRMNPKKYRRALAWAAQENRERRSDIGSVLSEGRIDVLIEKHPARYWPQGPMHYE